MNFEIMLLSGTATDGRVFGLDQQTLISTAIQLLNACILAVVLGFILYKPVRNFMHKRTDIIRGQVSDAQNKMAEADALKASYEKKLDEIDMERIKILESARIAAAEKSKHILEEARAEAANIRRHTEESILIEKERLKKEAKLYIIEVSSLMAAKFVEHTIDSDTQDKLFDETMAELEEARWLN